MAKKSFVLSNGDGRVTFSNTGSVNIPGVSIDDGNDGGIQGHISASTLYISGTVAFRNIANLGAGRLLSASYIANNIVFGTSSVSGAISGIGLSGALGYNATGAVLTNIMNPSDYVGIPSNQSYLSGNYKLDMKVINIDTVSSGALKVKYGGTGLTGSQYTSSANLILKGSGSGDNAILSVLSSSDSGTIVVSGEGRFNVQYPSYKPDVRFYGTPGTYTWTRPIGARFARIMLQGAGGGGSGGIKNATPANIYGGSGGASGGWSDIVIDLYNTQTSSIVVGSGGTGSITASAININTGQAGEDTYWTDYSNTYISYGGAGGRTGNNSARAVGGIGITKNGIGGTSYTTNNTPIVAYGMPSGGGCGGSGSLGTGRSLGGVIIPFLSGASRTFGYDTDTNGNLINILFSSGSSGSINTDVPPKPGYGAGGGGGWATSDNASRGGNGGDGYALIISW